MRAQCLGLVAVSMLIAGCQIFEDQAKREESDTTTAGARLLETNYERVDLVTLLDPDGMAQKNYVPLAGDPSTWGELAPGRQIDLALAAYHAKEEVTETKEPVRKQHRDQIQERLLGASNEMCYRYKRYLQNLHSDANFWFGALTTIAGAAGAIATGGASQALAGAAAALSGVRAEFNQDYFHNVTVATIWKGIEFRRQRAFDTIARQGQDKDTDVYPVEAAVKDAINYHAECSLVAGVEELGDAVQLAKDPGLDAVSRTLMKLNIARNIVENKSTDPADLLGDAAPGSPSASLLDFGTPRGSDTGLANKDPIAALGGFLQTAQKAGTDNTKIVTELTHWPEIGGTPIRQSIVGLVATRTAKTTDQLAACKDAALKASIDIATAESSLAVATTPMTQTRAAGDLAVKKASGEAVVNNMAVALTLLKDDFDASVGALQKAELAVAKTDQKIPDAYLKSATDSLKAANTNLQPLVCTP